MADIDELRGTPNGSTERSNTASQALKSAAVKAAAVATLATSTPAMAQPSVEKVPQEHKIENVQPARAPEIKADTLNYETEAQRVAGEMLGNMTLFRKDVYITENLSDNSIEEYKSPKQMSREFKEEQKRAWKEAPQEVQVERVDINNVSDISDGGGHFCHGMFDPLDKSVNIYPVYDDTGILAQKRAEQQDTKSTGSASLDIEDKNLASELDDENLLLPKEFYEDVEKHEKSHATVDKMNSYAPGLTWEQYAKLNAYDEIRANIVEVNNAVKKYAQDADLKHLENVGFKANEFKALTDAVHDGKVKVGDENYQKLLTESVSSYWTKYYMRPYEKQLRDISERTITPVSSLVLSGEGNVQSQKEFNKRLEKAFQNVDGMNLGKYVSDIELSADLKKQIETDRQIELNKRAVTEAQQSVLAQTKKPETIFQKVVKWVKKIDKDGERTPQEEAKATKKIAKKIIKLSGRSSNETPAPVTKTEASANLLAANIQRDGGR